MASLEWMMTSWGTRQILMKKGLSRSFPLHLHNCHARLTLPVILSDESPEVMGDSSFLRNEMPFWANLEEIAWDNIAREHEDGEATQQYRGSEFHNGHTEDVPPQESEAEIGDPPMNAGFQRSRAKPKKYNAQDLPQLRKQQRGKENHGPNGQPPQARPNIAQIYAERLNLKADYRKELTMKKYKWKALDLDGRWQGVRIEWREQLHMKA